MSEVRKEKRRLGSGDRFVIIALAVLIALTLVLTALQRAHIALLRGEVLFFLPFLVVFVLLGWGASAIFRRIRNRTARILVGGGLGLVLFLVVVVVFSYVSFVATLSLPQHFNTVTSPGGDKLALLRSLDTDEARINARKAERLAADPEAEDEVTVDDWGYLYRAYPRVARFFYRTDAGSEGELVVNYRSQATLMVDWEQSERTARFYLDEPGTGEGGELNIHY